MHEPPRVTISNPAAPAEGTDVLGDDGGDGSRRLPLVAVLGVLLLIGAGAALEVRERRADAAGERALQSVLELETTGRFGFGQTPSYDGLTDQALLSRVVGLRNVGPRGITVVGATTGGLTLVGEQVPVAPREEVRLVLEQRIPCAGRPALQSVDGLLHLEVRTGAGLRTSTLALPGDFSGFPDEGQRACGYLELDEAVRLQLAPRDAAEGDALLIDLTVENAGRAPARLLELQPGRGLSLELSTADGRPVPLPLELPPLRAGSGASVQSLQLRLRVADCAAVESSSTGTFEPDAADSLSYVAGSDEDDRGAGPSTMVLPDPGPVLDLLRRRCPGLVH